MISECCYNDDGMIGDGLFSREKTTYRNCLANAESLGKPFVVVAVPEGWGRCVGYQAVGSR